MLDALAARRTVAERVAIVVAHPDDETIAAGASLHMLPGLLLVHVTDGAPRRLADAAREGFASPAAYAAARERELQAALAVAGVTPARVQLEVPDQEVALHMRAVARELGRVLAAHCVEAVLTHAYEGGHPDHDATAFAAHGAARGLDLPVYEFAGYHAGSGAGSETGMVAQRFLPGPPEIAVSLTAAEAACKRAMLDCFATQAGILGAFSPAIERFRAAPGYDFAAPPHAGMLNYENWGWEMTGAQWRGLAAEARAA